MTPGPGGAGAAQRVAATIPSRGLNIKRGGENK